jgi:acetolactate synthase-1/2/3 large subunit
MLPLRFTTPETHDAVVLVSGAGDGDTGGGLCTLDGHYTEIIDRVSTSGITLFDGRLARLLRSPLNTGGGEVLIYDERGISHYLRIDDISDPHYMAWDGQHFIVASTGTNSLVWITLAGDVVRRWRAPGEDDSWHLNDVCLVEGQVYGCAFGRFAHYRGYKDHMMRGDGIVFDIATGHAVVTDLCAPHSPRYFDHAWTVCDSLRCSVVQVDEGHRKHTVQLRSFTRGLAVTDDYLIVGESVQRGPDNDRETGSVAILRRSDFSFVDRFYVPFREVSEIVIAPRHLVGAVKTGFRTNPLRLHEADQLQMFRDVGIEPKRLWAVSERLTGDQCKVRIDAKVPGSLACGRTAFVECTLQNLSEAFLCSELPFPVHLSYKWKSTMNPGAAADNGNRTRLPRMLPPGSTIQFGVDVQAPTQEGDYEIIITLVQEFVTWFDAVDPLNAFCAKVNVAEAKSIEGIQQPLCEER